ncbi:MAG: hypothetical protein MI923_06190 [Phycisphaerales bacterium]|nr:hypothetical protein [Phycisphaerales bacterium]
MMAKDSIAGGDATRSAKCRAGCFFLEEAFESTSSCNEHLDTSTQRL